MQFLVFKYSSIGAIYCHSLESSWSELSKLIVLPCGNDETILLTLRIVVSQGGLRFIYLNCC